MSRRVRAVFSIDTSPPSRSVELSQPPLVTTPSPVTPPTLSPFNGEIDDDPFLQVLRSVSHSQKKIQLVRLLTIIWLIEWYLSVVYTYPSTDVRTQIMKQAEISIHGCWISDMKLQHSSCLNGDMKPIYKDQKCQNQMDAVLIDIKRWILRAIRSYPSWLYAPSDSGDETISAPT